YIATENTQPIERCIVRIGRIKPPVAGECGSVGRQIELDQVRNVYCSNIGSTGWDSKLLTPAEQRIDQRCEFRVFRILAKELSVVGRRAAAVQVFVFDCDKRFIEE